jgi:hypothetical protein
MLSFGVYSQTHFGQFIELTKNKNEIKIPEFSYATLQIESEIEKIRKVKDYNEYPYEVKIEKNGSFKIDTSKIKGERLNLYFEEDDYAYLVLKNIPKSKLAEFIRVIPIVKVVWKATCGIDCFTIDQKRTYKRKKLTVKNTESKIEYHKKKNESVPSEIIKEIWLFDGKYYYEFEYKK